MYKARRSKKIRDSGVLEVYPLLKDVPAAKVGENKYLFYEKTRTTYWAFRIDVNGYKLLASINMGRALELFEVEELI